MSRQIALFYAQDARQLVGQMRLHIVRQEQRMRTSPVITKEILFNDFNVIEKLYMFFIRLACIKGLGPHQPKDDPFQQLLLAYRAEAVRFPTDDMRAAHAERTLEALLARMMRQLIEDIRTKWAWLLWSDQPWYGSIPAHRLPLPDAAMRQQEPPQKPLSEDELPEIVVQPWLLPGVEHLLRPSQPSAGNQAASQTSSPSSPLQQSDASGFSLPFSPESQPMNESSILASPNFSAAPSGYTMSRPILEQSPEPPMKSSQKLLIPQQAMANLSIHDQEATSPSRLSPGSSPRVTSPQAQPGRQSPRGRTE